MNKKAYTLLEIMVVVSIVAVTASFALPAMDSFMASQRVSADAEVFVQNVRLARYKALQESVLHRLVLDLDATNYVNGYKIEVYKTYDDGENLDLEGDVTDTSTILKVDTNYDSSEWESIIETDKVVIDGSVSVTYSGTAKVIYFYPTGYLVLALNKSGTKDIIRNEYVTNIGEEQLVFTYGNACVKVYMNAMGILSSESYVVGGDDV